MPRKLRALIRDLEQAGFCDRGGKGNHRNFKHATGVQVTLSGQDDEATVIQELAQIVEEWIAIFEEDGDPLPHPTAGQDYSGKFVLRVSPEMHKHLALRALSAGLSLNTYCVQQLSEVAT